MKTTEIERQQENQEIGALIRELVEKGFRPTFLKRFSPEHEYPYRRLIPDQNRKLVESLPMIVDALRKERGEPSLAEELENLTKQESEHSEAPVAVFGPDTACTCGSKAGLIVERKKLYEVDWCDGTVHQKDPDYPTIMPNYPQPGEIGKCPDCGKLWRPV